MRLGEARNTEIVMRWDGVRWLPATLGVGLWDLIMTDDGRVWKRSEAGDWLLVEDTEDADYIRKAPEDPMMCLLRNQEVILDVLHRLMGGQMCLDDVEHRLLKTKVTIKYKESTCTK